jgi:hypothetical protein
MSPDGGDASVYPFAPSPPLAQPSPPPPGGGPKQRRPRRARLGKTAAGLAVVLGAGTGAATVALTGSASGGPSLASSDSTASSSTTSTSAPGLAPSPGMPCRGKHGRFGYGPGLGPLGLAPGLFGVIHGTFTVKTPDGQFETIDAQTGTVESVASTSITVKSADGFSQTYQVTSSTEVGAEADGILSVKDGDQVSVEGLVSGNTVTAQRVLDITQLEQGHPSWVSRNGPWGDDGPPGPPEAA